LKNKIIIGILFSFILLMCIGTVSAEDMISKDDVTIDAYEYEDETLFSALEGDKVNVKVSSDIPVNAYILLSDDYYDLGYGSVPDADFSDAKMAQTGITSEISFSYTIPDDQNYYLVIYNPNNATATVSYEYTDLFDLHLEEAIETAEDIGWALGFFAIMVFVVIIVIIIVIVLIVYFLTRDKGPKQQYPGYPPQAYPPGYQHQPGYPYPPPYPGYPPQEPQSKKDAEGKE